jgi:hypothetical protein
MANKEHGKRSHPNKSRGTGMAKATGFSSLEMAAKVHAISEKRAQLRNQQETPATETDSGVLLKNDPETVDLTLRRTTPDPHSWQDRSMKAFGLMDEADYAELYQEAKRKGLVK